MMESRRVSREEEQSKPPALPVKQRRSRCSAGSGGDVDSEGSAFSPLGLQHQNFTYFADVFSEATDCHAVQCPIHHRYDPSHRHQERYHSDRAPPPVPKKRLARTLSLPGFQHSPPSPLSPVSPLCKRQLYNYPHNFDNPLYMLAPIPDDAQPHREREEAKPLSRSPVPLLPLAHLSFDTPDEQLPNFFSSFCDRGLVSQGIQHRHLLFLKSAAQNADARILLPNDAGDGDAGSHRPQDFQLCDGCKPKQIGDALYYGLHSTKFPQRILGARVHAWAKSTPPVHVTALPSNVNIQEVIVHFSPSGNQQDESGMLKTQDAPQNRPQEGDVESDTFNLLTALSLIQKGYAVRIERDLPHATLSDFIQDSRWLQRSEPSIYERQVCLLMLQLALGLQHLADHNAATSVELRPKDVFLVWARGEESSGEVTEGKDTSTAEKKETGTRVNVGKTDNNDLEWGEREKRSDGVQVLWRTRGTPRVVLAQPQPRPSTPTLTNPINGQLGAALLHCLLPRGRFASHPEPFSAAPSDSPYRAGLLRLASLLQQETSRGPQITDTVAILQALLWGPRAQLFQLNGNAASATVDSWLSIKRALLVLKLAERGLTREQSALDREDCLCLQYLSMSDCGSVVRAAEWLGLIGNVDKL